jgi:hypothetical protein
MAPPSAENDRKPCQSSQTPRPSRQNTRVRSVPVSPADSGYGSIDDASPAAYPRLSRQCLRLFDGPGSSSSLRSEYEEISPVRDCLSSSSERYHSTKHPEVLSPTERILRHVPDSDDPFMAQSPRGRSVSPTVSVVRRGRLRLPDTGSLKIPYIGRH